MTTEKLSEHFSRSEFVCRCGCGKIKIEPRLIAALEELRVLTGQPIHINSGYRCPAHNRAVGGETNSFHMKGYAADITCRGLTPRQVKKLAEKIPAFKGGGIGLYPGFTHVDVRGYIARW